MGKDFIIIDKEFGVKKWFRWTYGIFLGVMLNFILDVTFSLLYATYNLIQPIENYLWAIVLSYLVFELLFLVNARLNKDYQWEHKPIQRFSLQFISNTTIAIGIVEVSRLAAIISFHEDYYISLMDEKIIMTFTSIAVLIFTVLESGLFLMGKWRYSLAELERFKKENVEIRFESLRSQLNPHFLFNSLHTLSS